MINANEPLSLNINYPFGLETTTRLPKVWEIGNFKLTFGYIFEQRFFGKLRHG